MYMVKNVFMTAACCAGFVVAAVTGTSAGAGTVVEADAIQAATASPAAAEVELIEVASGGRQWTRIALGEDIRQFPPLVARGDDERRRARG
jgi:hypothetical protein